MASRRNWTVLTMLVALVMFLAACGMNEEPMPDPDTEPPGEITDTVEDPGTDPASEDDATPGADVEDEDGGDEDGEGDDEKDEGEKDDGKKDDEEDESEEEAGPPWNVGTATEECRYIAGVEGVDTPLFGLTKDGEKHWTMLDVEVEIDRNKKHADTVSWRDLEEYDGVEVMAVKVYGGENPETYWYRGEKAADHDSGLTAHLEADVSSVVVCATLDTEPTFEKTAQAELLRVWEWDLDKEAHDLDDLLDLVSELPENGTFSTEERLGPPAVIPYSIRIEADADVEARVVGEVRIQNHAPLPMKVTDLDDRIFAPGDRDGDEVHLDCRVEDGGKFEEGDHVPAWGTVLCEYEHELGDDDKDHDRYDALFAEGDRGDHHDPENRAWLDYRYEFDGVVFEGEAEARADFGFHHAELIDVNETARLHDTLVDFDEDGLYDIEDLFDGDDGVIRTAGIGLPPEADDEFHASGEDHEWLVGYFYVDHKVECGDWVENTAELTNGDGDLLAEDTETTKYEGIGGIVAFGEGAPTCGVNGTPPMAS